MYVFSLINQNVNLVWTILKLSSLKTLVALLAIFLVDAKIVFRYDFLAPLKYKNEYKNTSFIGLNQNNELSKRPVFLIYLITILIEFQLKFSEVFVFEPYNINGTWCLPLKFLKHYQVHFRI